MIEGSAADSACWAITVAPRAITDRPYIYPIKQQCETNYKLPKPPGRYRRGRSPSDPDRIRRVSRRGGTVFALRKTYLTDLDDRERSDQSKSAKNSKRWLLQKPSF